MVLVSVPYRGATFLNLSSSNPMTVGLIVSVPYRGATFLNADVIFYDLSAFPFPSPIGELHFSICYMDIRGKCQKVFPSPIGELHFSMLYSIHTTRHQHQCFRPLSGSYISQFYVTCEPFKVWCFRPLSGSYISQ